MLTPAQRQGEALGRGVADAQMDFVAVLFRPLLTVEEAAYLLAEPSRDLVIARLDDASLRGLDISLEGDASGRRELRLYRYRIEQLFRAHYLQRVSPRLPVPPAVPVEAILPHRRDVLRIDEVAQVLNCTARHVYALRAAGVLEGPSLSKASGPASVERTQRIARASLIAFLAAREIKP